MIEAIKTIFTKTGGIILIWFVVGVLAGPTAGHQGHFPATDFSSDPGGVIGAWVQEVIWILFWPLGLIFHHPTFSL